MTKRKPRRARRTRDEHPRDVKVAHPSYQPSKAELEADIRVNASFEEAVKAIARPVRMRYAEKPF